MTIPKHIKDFHNGINDLETRIQDDTEKMLRAINIDELLSNPELYLTTLANLFLEKHQKVYKEAFDMGIDHGKKMVELDANS